MKFLCDNCKAKYQIADDKVAGKTVRMKCRKCGHQIEVRAAVTETSVARPPPRPPAGAPSKPPAKSTLATSLSATKPRVPTAQPTGASAPPSALAGAFKSNVQDAPASGVTSDAATAASIELSVGDEWYVAINGVPVGPVRLSELRRKAASGAVTEESLCWQEGLEEWRPIRSIPDLAALVREAALGGRPSIISTPDPSPVAPRASAPPRPPAPSAPSAAPAPPPAPRSLTPLAPQTGRNNVVPLRPAAAAVAEDLAIAASGSAAPAAALVAVPSPVAPAAPEVASDPFALPAPVAAAAPAPAMAAPATFSQPPPPRQEAKRGPPLWFWPVALAAVGFGVTVAVMVFRPQPAQGPVVIQMPAPTATETATAKADIPPPIATAEASAAPSAEAKKPGTAVATKTGGAVAAKTADVPEKKGIDLGNLMPGTGGPNVGPNSAPGAGGGGLDSAGVERVVASHRNGVKRTCWERGGADQKSSVNVTVTAVVAPNGMVSSTSSSGDDPVVAKCIENQVRTWQFPAPGSSTTLNIPFKFVRQ